VLKYRDRFKKEKFQTVKQAINDFKSKLGNGEISPEHYETEKNKILEKYFSD
jgi:uncharacterized membrane protein